MVVGFQKGSVNGRFTLAEFQEAGDVTVFETCPFAVVGSEGVKFAGILASLAILKNKITTNNIFPIFHDKFDKYAI